MVDALSDFIKQISEDKRVMAYNEARTKQAIILEILFFLGWDTADIDEVTPEFEVKKFKVDYALGNHSKKYVFIEVKKPSEDLSRHEGQVVQYAFRAGVKCAILTNGIRWQFFLPQYGDEDWESKKFYDITLNSKNAKSIGANFIKYLSKTNVMSKNEKAKKIAETLLRKTKNNIKIEETLPNAWNKVIKENKAYLTSLIIKSTKKISNLTPNKKQIEKFLDQKLLNVITSNYTDQDQQIPRNRLSTQSSERKLFAKKPTKIVFKGKSYPINSYREALFEFIKLIRMEHSNDFPKVLKLKGSKRPSFSKKPLDLRTPKLIPGTDIYCEVNLSAKSIERLMRKILNIFNYPEEIYELV